MRGLATVILAGIIAGIVGQAAAAPNCSGVALRLTQDYAWGVGSADYVDPGGVTESGSLFRLYLNETEVLQGVVAEGLLLGFEGTVAGAGGETPMLASQVAYTNGVHGGALLLGLNGALRYAADGNLFLDEGTIEMRVALREPGANAVYATMWQPLLEYHVSDGEYFAIAQSQYSGVIYAGGAGGGQWQSAYSPAASTRGWAAGEWHHLACAFSAAGQFIRLYVDGALVADTNEGRYRPPAAGGAFFTVGGDRNGLVARYLIEEVRLSGRAATSEEIAARAARPDAPRANEVWAPTTGLKAGDSVQYRFTPSNGVATGATGSATMVFPGIPLASVSPPSTLLPCGTVRLPISLASTSNAVCRFAVGQPLPFEDMAPFAEGDGDTQHVADVFLNPTPNVVNHVYVRCDTAPDYLLHLRYRCLSSGNPSFPRTGNLWGWSYYMDKPSAEQARIDLWIADDMPRDKARELRAFNPDVRVLTSINAVQNKHLPDDYYLKDVHGNRVEVWPGSHRLNLTKPAVADYQARAAAQRILDADLAFDGCFFDNVMLSQSWLTKDIHGNPFVADYDENGLPDDPAAFDAAWKAGVLRELEVFRRLMPHALVSGHAMDLVRDPEVAELFHGISLGFDTANVIEGESEFDRAFDNYNTWCVAARDPRMTLVESSPLDLFAYGYGYKPLSQAPADARAFARDHGPWMRFGLAFTLLNDGYFAHEWGDTAHGQAWWYDELDFDLGLPLGPAQRVVLEPLGPEQIVNGSFETDILPPWVLHTVSGATATVTRAEGPTQGAYSARVTVAATSGAAPDVEFNHLDNPLEAGRVYEVAFQARADASRTIMLTSRKGSPDWRLYGLSRSIRIGTEWSAHSLHFTATETAGDARLQFLVGGTTGNVWLAAVSLRAVGPDVYRRDFDRGIVLLNATRQPQTIALGPGFRHLVGAQAPRVDLIVDDADAAFVADGAWGILAVDSGEWGVNGPYYHDWGVSCHVGAGGDARWTATLTDADTYTFEAWWPAYPTNEWSAVRYEVVANGMVVAATTVDQGAGGDRWYPLAVARLPSNCAAVVRARSTDGRPWIADAVRIHGNARYNDGSAVRSVTLAPMDGVVLQRSALRLLVQLDYGTGGYLELGPDGAVQRYMPLVENADGWLLRSLDGPRALLQRGTGGEIGLLELSTGQYTKLSDSVPGWIARGLSGDLALGQKGDGGESVLVNWRTGAVEPLLGPAPGWALRALDDRRVLGQNVGTGQVLLWDRAAGVFTDLGYVPGWQAADYAGGWVLLQQGPGGDVYLQDPASGLGKRVVGFIPGAVAVSLDEVWPAE